MDLALRIVAPLLVSGGLGTAIFGGQVFLRGHSAKKAAKQSGERLLAQWERDKAYPFLFIGAMLIIIGSLFFVVT